MKKRISLAIVFIFVIISVISVLNLNSKKDREIVEKLLKEELKKDRTKTQVEGFTKLNLMELTRKHICSNYK